MMRRHGRRVGFSVGTLFGMLGVTLAALELPSHFLAVVSPAPWWSASTTHAASCTGSPAAEVAAPTTGARSPGRWPAASSAAWSGPTSRAIPDLVSVAFAGSYAVLVLPSRSPRWWCCSSSARSKPRLNAQAEAGRWADRAPADLHRRGDGGSGGLWRDEPPDDRDTLAMQMCTHPFADTAVVLEWHVIGMFAPFLHRRPDSPPLRCPQDHVHRCAPDVRLRRLRAVGNDVMHFLGALFVLGWAGTSCSSAARPC